MNDTHSSPAQALSGKPRDGKVQAGQRIGMIRVGSRVNCELPQGFKLQVSKGEMVQAGTSVLARCINGGNSDE